MHFASIYRWIGLFILCFFVISTSFISFAAPLSSLGDYFTSDQKISYSYNNADYYGYVIDSTEWYGNLTLSYGNQISFPRFYSVACYLPIVRNNDYLFPDGQTTMIMDDVRFPAYHTANDYYNIDLTINTQSDSLMFYVQDSINGQTWPYTFYMGTDGFSQFDFLGFSVVGTSSAPRIMIFYKQNMYVQYKYIDVTSTASDPSGGLGLGSALSFSGYGYILGLIDAPMSNGTDVNQIPTSVFGQMWVNLYNRCDGINQWLLYRQQASDSASLKSAIQDLVDQYQSPPSYNPDVVVDQDKANSDISSVAPDKEAYQQAEDLDSEAKSNAQAGIDAVNQYDTINNPAYSNYWAGVSLAASILNSYFLNAPWVAVVLGVFAMFTILTYLTGKTLVIHDHSSSTSKSLTVKDDRRDVM